MILTVSDFVSEMKPRRMDRRRSVQYTVQYVIYVGPSEVRVCHVVFPSVTFASYCTRADKPILACS